MGVNGIGTVYCEGPEPTSRSLRITAILVNYFNRPSVALIFDLLRVIAQHYSCLSTSTGRSLAAE